MSGYEEILVGGPTEIPNDTPPDANPGQANSRPEPSGDPTCVVCGAPLSYSGRGRKPRYCEQHKRQTTTAPSGSRSTRTTADVDKAMAVLNSFYDATTVGLLLVSPPTASVWNEGLPQLRNADVLALQSDADLTRTICRMGETSGKAMFFTAHVVAAAPVAMTLMRDLAARRAERRSRAQDDELRDMAHPDVPPPSADYGNAGFFQ